MPVASLVRMANQIAANYRSKPADVAAKEVATHIRSFWAPSMRADLFNFVADGGGGLDPVVLLAVERLRAPAS
jgi:formate dehydrogenase subunit delta